MDDPLGTSKKDTCKNMIKFDEIRKENAIKHNANWSQIPDHPCRIVIIGSSRSGKTNALLDVINHQPKIDKSIYMLRIHKKQKMIFLLINVNR